MLRSPPKSPSDNGGADDVVITEVVAARYATTYRQDGRQVRPIVHHKSGNASIAHQVQVYRSNCMQMIYAVFLPAGYPNSVTDDYMEYQLWDTLQAFASSINGALATQAILKGVGVGDETADTLAATMTWLIKDGIGHVGRISFAYCQGTKLDSDCKKWRLAADLLNDASLMLDLVTPLLPRVYFTPIVCMSSVFRACVGVAGGATRAAITQHQALNNNVCDVSAKDGSQETLVNLSALIVSIYLLPLVNGAQGLIWTLFCVLIVLHLYANWRAVTSLQLRSINGKRLRIALRHFLQTDCEQMPSVKSVNQLEAVVLDFVDYSRPSCDEPIAGVLASLAERDYHIHLNVIQGRILVLYSTDADSDTILSSAIAAESLALKIRGEVTEEELKRGLSLPSSTVIGRLVDAGWSVDQLLLSVGEYRIELDTYGDESRVKNVRFSD